MLVAVASAQERPAKRNKDFNPEAASLASLFNSFNTGVVVKIKSATIAKDGTIQNLQLLGGPPLLVQAAMQAVQQWQYKPTLLNGEPVEVITTIDVNFTLSQ